MVWLPSVRTAAVPRRCSTSSGRQPARATAGALPHGPRAALRGPGRPAPVGAHATRALRSPCNG